MILDDAATQAVRDLEQRVSRTVTSVLSQIMPRTAGHRRRAALPRMPAPARRRARPWARLSVAAQACSRAWDCWPFLASAPWSRPDGVAATAVGAVAGGAAGGLVGSLTSAGVRPEHAEIYAEGVRRGGSIVTARVDDTIASRAESILSDRGAVDPDVRGAAYRQSGWTRFDEKGATLHG